jgi:hypothetical protein
MKKNLVVLLTIAGVSFASIAAADDLSCQNEWKAFRYASKTLHGDLKDCENPRNEAACQQPNSSDHQTLQKDTNAFFEAHKAAHDCDKSYLLTELKKYNIMLPFEKH